ncbi:MAG: urease accessory protein UreF [Labilithrix sp.]|nr:urease accessory protein UreF [Labilithrix sp.]
MTTPPRATDRWLLLQLADGTFPSGGFAHSAGLEAALVLGAFDNAERREGAGSDGAAEALERFVDASLCQLGRAALPFVRAAALEPSRLAELDDAFDCTSTMIGPNRASRSQGRALASAASRVWGRVAPVVEHARRGPAHHPPVFGAVFGLLGVGVDDALAAYLHGALRGILSAGVRLGLAGPLEAQRLHAAAAPRLDAIVDGSRALQPEDAAQTAPLLEIFAALHERLDGRMFQS